MMVLVTLAVALAGWFLAEKIGLSAPAMLGSMIAVGATNVIFGYADMPDWIRVFAQGISGAFIGMSITRSDLLHMRKLALPGLLLVALFTINTIVMGVVIHHVCGLDLFTALFSCIAGGVTDISLIAMDYDADVGTVGLMQTARLVAVLLLFPGWIKLVCRDQPDAPHVVEPGEHGRERGAHVFALLRGKREKAGFTVAVAIVCGALGMLSGVPAGAMVFPLFAVAALNLSVHVCYVPLQVKNIAQLLAGSLVGVSMTPQTFSSLSTTLLPVVLLVGSYWLVNFIYAMLCQMLKLLDLKSALFVSAPGGATDIALIAADLNADLTKIAVLQVMRAVYAVTLMPAVVLAVAPLL